MAAAARPPPPTHAQDLLAPTGRSPSSRHIPSPLLHASSRIASSFPSYPIYRLTRLSVDDFPAPHVQALAGTVYHAVDVGYGMGETLGSTSYRSSGAYEGSDIAADLKVTNGAPLLQSEERRLLGDRFFEYLTQIASGASEEVNSGGIQHKLPNLDRLDLKACIRRDVTDGQLGGLIRARLGKEFKDGKLELNRKNAFLKAHVLDATAIEEWIGQEKFEGSLTVV